MCNGFLTINVTVWIIALLFWSQHVGLLFSKEVARLSASSSQCVFAFLPMCIAKPELPVFGFIPK
ncbi:hypothetical protein D3C80_2126390 [compost metagenome]